MEKFAEVLSGIVALLLTVSCGLLFGELLFGGLVRLFFASQPGAGKKPAREQEEKREPKCLP